MALLEVGGVSKRFGGIRALTDVSIEVSHSEAVGLIGQNGAGKTTLFNCISGSLRADSGQISLGGRRIDELPIYQRTRLGIGRTFQRVELFGGMTVREHLVVAAREHSGNGRLWKDLLWRARTTKDEEASVDRIMEALGLADIATAQIEALSLGQGRLVELGRALVQEPRLLLLDEPSSGLDSRETASLARILNGVRRETGCAYVVVEHDLDLVQAVAERVYVLEEGRILASGGFDEVFANAAVRRSYLGDGR